MGSRSKSPHRVLSHATGDEARASPHSPLGRPPWAQPDLVSRQRRNFVHTQAMVGA